MDVSCWNGLELDLLIVVPRRVREACLFCDDMVPGIQSVHHFHEYFVGAIFVGFAEVILFKILVYGTLFVTFISTFSILLIFLGLLILFLVIYDEVEIFDSVGFLGVFDAVSRYRNDVILHRLRIGADVDYLLVEHLQY